MKLLNQEIMYLIVWAILSFLHPVSLAQGLADEPERISVAELKRLLDNGALVILVDARSRQIYNMGHLPKAISMPFPEQIQTRHDQLPKDRLIVLY